MQNSAVHNFATMSYKKRTCARVNIRIRYTVGGDVVDLSGEIEEEGRSDVDVCDLHHRRYSIY